MKKKKQKTFDEIMTDISISQKSVVWWRAEMNRLLDEIDLEEAKSALGEVDQEKLEKLQIECDNLVRKGRFEINQIDVLLAEVNKYVENKKKK